MIHFVPLHFCLTWVHTYSSLSVYNIVYSDCTQDDSVSSVNNTNPYNEDPPVSDEDFVTEYNSQADAFNENLKVC